jgi:hypothetical protein
MYKRTSLLAAAAAVTVTVSVVVVGVVAQMPSGRDGGGFSPFPGSGPGDGLAEVQTKIRASDEEWKVIGPKLRRVMAASTALETSIDESSGAGPSVMSWGRGGRGGPGGGPGGDSFAGPGDGGAFGRGGPGGGLRGGPRGGPGGDSFAGPGDGGAFGRGGPGPGGFGRGGRESEGFGPGGPGPEGFGPDGPGSEGFGPGGRGGPGGFGRGGPGGPPGLGTMAIMQRMMELQTTLADPNATSEQLKEKVAAVRSERQKAKAELTAARKDLFELLTLDQEATLVGLSYLD